MKCKLLLILLSISLAASVYPQVSSQSVSSALFYKSISLDDGDSICVTPKYPNDEYCSGEEEIINRYSSKLFSSGIMKSFDIQKHEEDIKSMINGCKQNLYNSIYYIPGILYYFNDSYVRGLVKVKKVREFGYGIIKEMLVDLCEYFPKDYTTNMISVLEDAQKTIKKFKKHRYECVLDEYGTPCLFVDGEINNEIPYTDEGFIARRICMDNIPVDELEDFVSSLLSLVKEVDIADNPDVLFKMTINDELSYCLGIDGPYFVFENKKKKVIPFEDKYHNMYYFYYGQKVFFTKGSDGSFYKIRNYQNCHSDKWESLFYRRYWDDVVEMIFDSKGNEVYRYVSNPNEK